MFFLVHKPLGVSSFSCINHIKRHIGARRIGHAGTLDPLASGLLLVATDAYTRLLHYLPAFSKTYRFTVRLDGSTDTGDLASEIVPLPPETVERARDTLTLPHLADILDAHFHGAQRQTPHRHSAVWVDGQRAYRIARKGGSASIPERDIEIHSYVIERFDFPEITLVMEVSSGTYIRSIAEDLGARLGLAGYVTSLERVQIGALPVPETFIGEMRDTRYTGEISLTTVLPDIPRRETTEDIRRVILQGLVMENTLGLGTGERTFLTCGGREYSLVEEHAGTIRILVNLPPTESMPVV